MNYFDKDEKGYYVCTCCNAMTWKPEDHRCDGIRKKQLMALVQAATDSIRSLSDHLPVRSREYYCQEADEILCGAGMIIEEQWDKDK